MKKAFSSPSFRGRVTLLELVFVTLFFALSSVVILRLFIASSVMRDESRACAEATVSAQDWADRLYDQADMRAYLLENGWQEGEGGALTLPMDEFVLTASGFETQGDEGGALRACRIAAAMGDTPLLELPVSRYALAREDAP